MKALGIFQGNKGQGGHLDFGDHFLFAMQKLLLCLIALAVVAQAFHV